MLTTFGRQFAHAGTFFDQIYLGLHAGDPATPTNELAGYAYERVESPMWHGPADRRYATAEVARWPRTTGAWVPFLSLGFWRHVPGEEGLLGSIPIPNAPAVDKREVVALTRGQILGGMLSDDEMGGSLFDGVALAALTEGTTAAINRLSHASLHTGFPATKENEFQGFEALDGVYEELATGDRMRVAVTPALVRDAQKLIAGTTEAAGYRRAEVPGWTLRQDGQYEVTGGLDWSPPPYRPVRRFTLQPSGRSAVYPRPGGKWPATVAVGFSNSADGEIQGWTTRFAGNVVAQRVSPAASFRLQAVLVNVFDLAV